jgi:hypothetical protein
VRKNIQGEADIREHGTTEETFHIRTTPKLEKLTDCEGLK